MHKWLILVALIVPDAALRYCIAQALEPQPRQLGSWSLTVLSMRFTLRSQRLIAGGIAW